MPSEATMLDELKDDGSLARTGSADNDDTTVRGQVRAEIVADLPEYPVATDESGVGLASGNLEEERLQRPIQLTELWNGT